MKSLNELLRRQNENTSQINSGEEMIIKCPNCGTKRRVPAYETDYTCDACITRQDMNLDLFTSSGWNMARSGILRKRKRNLVFTTTPHPRTRSNKVKDET